MSMRSAFCSTVAVAILGLTAALGGQRAHVDVTPTQPVALSVLGLDFVDTSGEPTDQTAAHQRAADFVSALQRDLVANGQYRVVPMSCGSAPCEPVMNPAELQKAARAAGARFVVLGSVHKMSTLVRWAKIQVADEEQGELFLIGC
jgi:TolB-like protein